MSEAAPEIFLCSCEGGGHVNDSVWFKNASFNIAGHCSTRPSERWREARELGTPVRDQKTIKSNTASSKKLEHGVRQTSTGILCAKIVKFQLSSIGFEGSPMIPDALVEPVHTLCTPNFWPEWESHSPSENMGGDAWGFNALNGYS